MNTLGVECGDKWLWQEGNREYQQGWARVVVSNRVVGERFLGR